MSTLEHFLVAGGAGFIGSHLCEGLLAAGHRVTCVDDFSTGRRENVAALLPHPRFELVEHDVIEPRRYEADAFFNLACPAAPVHYQKDPVRTLKSSVFGAAHLLESAARCGARFLQASTSEIYGDPEIHPQPESYTGRVNPLSPRACYEEGKRAAETMAFDYRRKHGVDVRLARIFNTYGPRLRLDDGRVIPTFTVQALGGKPLTIHGDGTSTRSFCFVDDLVEGLLRLMAVVPAPQGPVNLGRPEEVSILDLAQRILSLCGSRSDLVHLPPAVDDPVRRRPDISLAQRLLGWEPKTALAEGLQITIEDLRKRMAISR